MTVASDPPLKISKFACVFQVSHSQLNSHNKFCLENPNIAVLVEILHTCSVKFVNICTEKVNSMIVFSGAAKGQQLAVAERVELVNLCSLNSQVTLWLSCAGSRFRRGT